MNASIFSFYIMWFVFCSRNRISPRVVGTPSTHVSGLPPALVTVSGSEVGLALPPPPTRVPGRPSIVYGKVLAFLTHRDFVESSRSVFAAGWEHWASSWVLSHLRTHRLRRRRGSGEPAGSRTGDRAAGPSPDAGDTQGLSSWLLSTFTNTAGCDSMRK